MEHARGPRLPALFATLALALSPACVGQIRDVPGSDGGAGDANPAVDSGAGTDATVITADSAPPDGRANDARANDASDAGGSTDAGPACAQGQMLCGSPPACTTVVSDPAHCGDCNTACAAGQVCSNGQCSATCSLTTCGTACVDTRSDPSHCGNCTTACAAGQSCVSGACVCGAGLTNCGGACVDTQSDPAHCGGCNACPAGQTCNAGTCQVVCAGTQVNCGGACVDTQSDPAHCGGCATRCPSGQTCNAGACGCAAGLTSCGGSCVDTRSDSSNCGGCGNACPAGQSCSGGACVAGVVCGPPPAGVSANAAAAYTLENQIRAAMGIPCARMDVNANQGAANHCAYYAANRGTSCTSNPHVEVSTCSMYTGMNFWDRMSYAGYAGSPAFEDMAFVNDGTGAVQMWIDSIWHRTPVLSPWVADIGYGSASGCDTMDFGRGSGASYDVVATYPYNNQTGVPTAFYGNEGPPPPAPPSGWPSGYPIHIWIQGTISAYQLAVDGSSTPIDGVWLGPGDPRAMNLLRTEYVFYANTPLASGTRYRFTATGSNSAGAVNLNWVFTTR